ncbi:MAG: cation acetate symporter [Zoogloeaceae bacterium]|jgi:cation/acetate symporter|nr:cation acetate symporter [Zoogloeaceae bacterium]
MPALTFAFALLLCGLPLPAQAAEFDFSLHDLLPQQINHWLITAVFAGVVFVALVVARLAALKPHTEADASDTGLAASGFQNGLAITGHYLSGASFPGVAALIVSYGYDGLLYALGFLAGWPFMALLFAERLKNLGMFTLGDVLAWRLDNTALRIFAAVGSLVVTLIYLAAQLSCVGQLIRLLFGFEYGMGVVIVGAMMLIYSRTGGIFATTQLAIVKAVLLFSGVTVLAFMAIHKFGFSFEAIPARASALQGHPVGRDAGILSPGVLLSDPVSMISLGLALVCGLVGLPHILMRFFTAPNARTARKSALWATILSGYFYMLSIVIGFSAILFALSDPAYRSLWNSYRGGDNMTSLYLAYAVGGEITMGVMAAILFLTLLSVAAGLTLAGAAVVSHDLYAIVARKGRPKLSRERRVSHLAALALGAAAIGLGLAAEHVNVAMLVSLAFGIAASAHFPVLVLVLFWQRCTTRGALVGGCIGLISSVLLTLFSPLVWVTMLGNETAIFPYASPALFSMSAAFLGIWLFSRTDRTPRGQSECVNFTAQKIRAEIGVGGL